MVSSKRQVGVSRVPAQRGHGMGLLTDGAWTQSVLLPRDSYQRAAPHRLRMALSSAPRAAVHGNERIGTAPSD